MASTSAARRGRTRWPSSPATRRDSWRSTAWRPTCGSPTGPTRSSCAGARGASAARHHLTRRPLAGGHHGRPPEVLGPVRDPTPAAGGTGDPRRARRPAGRHRRPPDRRLPAYHPGPASRPRGVVRETSPGGPPPVRTVLPVPPEVEQQVGTIDPGTGCTPRSCPRTAGGGPDRPREGRPRLARDDGGDSPRTVALRGFPCGLAFSPDGSRLAIDAGTTIYVHDALTLERLGSWKAKYSYVPAWRGRRTAACSPGRTTPPRSASSRWRPADR